MLKIKVLFGLLCLVFSTIQAQNNDYKNKINKLKRQYDWVFTDFEEKIIPVKKNDKIGYVRISDLKEVLPCSLDVLLPKPFSEGLAAVDDFNKGIGFIDTTGKLVIPHQFKYTSQFREDVCYVQASDRKNYFIDKKGTKLFQVSNGAHTTFTNGIYINTIDKGNNKYEFQYLDKTGKPIIPTKYQNATIFENGLACVSKDGVNFGYINQQGKTVIPEVYRYCSSYDYTRPLALFKNNSDKPYFYDIDGTLLNQDTTIESIFHLKDDYFVVKKYNGKFGIIDKNQKYILEPTLNFLYKTAHYYCTENGIFDLSHQKISDFPLDWTLNSIQEVVILEKRDKYRKLYTFIDKDGNLSKKVFISIQKYFTNGLLVCQDTLNKVGLIQSNNTAILPFEYNKVISSREIEPNHYIIKKDKKQGVVDFTGKVVIPVVYDTLFFNDTYRTPAYDAFIVKKDNLWGVIDIFGDTIIPIEYEYISGNLLGLAQKNGKMGLIDKNGKMLAPFEYDNIDIAEDSRWLRLEKEGRYGVADAKTLKVIAPAIFDYYELDSKEIRNAIIGTLQGKKQIFSYQGNQLTELIDNIAELPVSDGYYTGYMIEKNKKFGVLDTKYNTVLPLEFDRIKNIKNKFYIATKNNKEYFYQKDGRALYEGEIDKILNSEEEGLLIVKTKNKVGLLEIEDLAGIGENEIHEIIDATLRLQHEYDNIEKTKETPLFYKVTKDKKIGIYSKYERKIIIPIEYDSIENMDTKGGIILKKGENSEIYLLLANGKAVRQD